MGPLPLFGPSPLAPLYRSQCGMGGSGGPINPNLGSSGWGNGGGGLTPGYDIGRPLNYYEEALRFTPPPVAPPPYQPVVLPPVFKPEPLIDLSWRKDLLPGCDDDLCHLGFVPCHIQFPKEEVSHSLLELNFAKGLF